MEETKTSSFKVAINHGLMLGGVLIVFSYLMYLLGVDFDSKLQYFSYIIMIAGLFIGIKQWRDKYNNGFISYGDAFKNGFFTMLIAGILTSIWVLLFFTVVAPDEIGKMLEIAEEKMYESQPDMTDEQLDLAMKWTKMFMSPLWMAIWGFLGNIFAGLVLSAIIAIFIKKEKPFFAE